MLKKIKNSILISNNVDITISDFNLIFIRGYLGEIKFKFNNLIIIKKNDNYLEIDINKNINFRKNKYIYSQIGTTISILNNMMYGVTNGFTKKLILVGIGYKAIYEKDNNIINLYLGYSHIIKYKIHKDIKLECPNQNEIILKSINKQLLGQTAANIRSYRIPEIYKGTGIKYDNEKIIIKEIKKNK